MEKEKVNEIDENTEIDSSQEERINTIEIELQKLEIEIQQLEDQMTYENNQEKYMDKYEELKTKYNELLKERKSIKPKTNSAWDEIPTWMVFYGLFQFLFCLPLASQALWIFWHSWIVDIFEEQLKVLLDLPQVYLVVTYSFIVYSLPLINILLSWLIYVNFVKEDFDKKVFRLIWIGQTVLTVVLGVWLYFEILAPTLG